MFINIPETPQELEELAAVTLLKDAFMKKLFEVSEVLPEDRVFTVAHSAIAMCMASSPKPDETFEEVVGFYKAYRGEEVQ